MIAESASQPPRIQGEQAMSDHLIQWGRPRLLVDYGLVLALREREHLGWFRVATEYIRRTGQYISKQTCKRRYEEVKLGKAVMAAPGQKLKYPRPPPD